MHQVQIRVRGQIDERWSEWLEGLDVSQSAEDVTVLSGGIRDQPALYGLLSKLRDLGLVLLAVEVGEGAAGGNCRGTPAWSTGPRPQPARR